MKVLSICPAYYPAIRIGGPIFYCRNLHKILATNLKIEVDVMTTNLGLDVNFLKTVQYGKWMNIDESTRLIYFKYYGYKHFTFSPDTILFLYHNAYKYDYVMLQGTWNFPILAGGFFARSRKLPYIIYPHGTLYKETLEMKSKYIKKVILKVFLNSMLRDAYKIIFTTHDEMNKVTNYLKLGGDNAVVIPIAIDTDKYVLLPEKNRFRKNYPILKNKRYLIHFGRITRKKGLDILIVVFAKLLEDFHDLMLVIAGGDDEQYSKELRKLISKYGIEHNILFTGLLGEEEGKEALVDADLFILPSYSENFGMAVVEAMLCKTPVVISNNVGIYEDIMANNVGVVVPLTESNYVLYNAIKQLLEDVKSREILGEAGRKFAINNYCFAGISDKIALLLRRNTYSSKH